MRVRGWADRRRNPPRRPYGNVATMAPRHGYAFSVEPNPTLLRSLRHERRHRHAGHEERPRLLVEVARVVRQSRLRCTSMSTATVEQRLDELECEAAVAQVEGLAAVRHHHLAVVDLELDVAGRRCDGGATGRDRVSGRDLGAVTVELRCVGAVEEVLELDEEVADPRGDGHLRHSGASAPRDGARGSISRASSAANAGGTNVSVIGPVRSTSKAVPVTTTASAPIIAEAARERPVPRRASRSARRASPACRGRRWRSRRSARNRGAHSSIGPAPTTVRA